MREKAPPGHVNAGTHAAVRVCETELQQWKRMSTWQHMLPANQLSEQGLTPQLASADIDRTFGAACLDTLA